MTVGVVMLVHEALHRAGELARHWSDAGCPVVIHVDSNVGDAAFARLRGATADLGRVTFCKRFRCEWGTWSLVQATQAAAEQMLRQHEDVRHVYLTSGSCLPLRPVAELKDYLAARPRTDFIESATTADVAWTVGGLSAERFTLRFPFSWRRQRALFDRAVALQRRAGYRRRIPPGIEPHLGSQWWCLTRQTLSAILTDPARAERDRYFRQVWIPDESYFQTLARNYAVNIESRSLTLSKFDFQGKPHIFYDDHLQLLRRSDCFVARKIWPRADRLWAAFLAPPADMPERSEPQPGKIDRLFARAVERRTRGRPGLFMQSRYPREGFENGKTANPFSVFEGFDRLFEDFEGWLGRALGTDVHGRLFDEGGARFADGGDVHAGGLPAAPAVRDHNCHHWFRSLVWNTRGKRQCFMFGPEDAQDITWHLSADGNGDFSVITGAWAIPLFQQGGDFAETRRLASRLQRIEQGHVEILRSPHSRARTRIWSLSDVVLHPMAPLQQILDEIGPKAATPLAEAPRMVDLSGFSNFLRALKNQGMHLPLVGDFPAEVEVAGPPSERRRRRPYLVK
ncbi:core-2/I-Branching enzyme [Hasllibacter halocynthiae]|uniref:Peptide O-xylosyltransferase n=1 Tax=Hasllibacter halocynthiae TaxID=595589 RepID=A0A2T0X232_9RHOB|nr:beta-1,6-N-acetylglucosaminyltransferase [Hasllibacter halocynthiae]PRY93009.1 core-2/I-Branching enzyme [Hasllibacter halocynthiae]